MKDSGKGTMSTTRVSILLVAQMFSTGLLGETLPPRALVAAVNAAFAEAMECADVTSMHTTGQHHFMG